MLCYAMLCMRMHDDAIKTDKKISSTFVMINTMTCRPGKLQYSMHAWILEIILVAALGNNIIIEPRALIIRFKFKNFTIGNPTGTT